MPHRLTRPMLTLAALAGLAASFTAGAWLTGGGSGEGPDGYDRAGTGVLPVGYSGGDLALAESCDELLDWYVDRGVARVGPWGWELPYLHGTVLTDGGGVRQFTAAAGAEDQAATSGGAKAPGLPSTVRVENGGTGTNVQEVGVDEPDVVKTDGRTLFRVESGDLVTYDVTGADVERLGSAELPDAEDAEILLAGDTVVAIGHDRTATRSYPDGTGTESTTVLVLDVSDPAEPALEHSYIYDTEMVTARLHGSTVRLVLQAGLPDLPFVTPERPNGGPSEPETEPDSEPDPYPGDERDALRENQRIVRDSTIEDWLPTVSTDGADPEQLMGCDQVALPTDGDTLGTIAVVGFDAAAPDDPSVTGLAVDTDLTYASASRLYLATAPYASVFGWGWGGCMDCDRPTSDSPTIIDMPIDTPRWFPGRGDDGTSHVYAFDLDGLDTTYQASGEVDGFIRDRWAMDEYDGVLRLALGPTSRTGNFNSIVTLREEGDDLVEIGRLDHLGVDEQIQSVRWFDSLAIVVTFRQIDPLYAIDLTDPEDPELMGKLKIPGFSAYLHPLGGHRLLGLGEGPGERGQWGAQAGLFNVTDLTSPTQLDVVSYGPGTRANAVDDPRQLTWLPEQRVVLTVVTDWGKAGGATGYISVLRLGDGDLANRMVEVEYGDEVTAVRLVPLPDGRVVLVTGDDAEFFAL